MWTEEVMAARSWCRDRMLVFMAASMTGDTTCMFTVIADFTVAGLRTAAGDENDDAQLT